MQSSATPTETAAPRYLADGPDARPAADSPGGAGHCDLLVAADSGLPHDVATALRSAGVDVTGLVSSPSELADVTHPHTLLWPLWEPGMHGQQVRRQEMRGQAIAAAAARRGWPVVVLASTSDPRFVRAAVAVGATGYLTAPFTHARLLPTLELAAARTADIAGLRAEVAEVTERLDTRKVVERAKGLLMAQQQLTEQAAFRLIQRTAMDRRRSMRDVAHDITTELAGAA